MQLKEEEQRTKECSEFPFHLRSYTIYHEMGTEVYKYQAFRRNRKHYTHEASRSGN